MYEVQGEARFIPFGDSANYDVRCTVCTECTMGSEIFWTHLMELLGGVGHVESCSGPLGDGVSIGERLVHALRQTHLGLEINLDVIDGTPR
jgi:hypothetical protein